MSRQYTSEEQIIRNALQEIQNTTRIPIREVVDTISGNISESTSSKGGFVKYRQLIEEAKKDSPYAIKPSSPGSNNPYGFDANDAFKSLTTAAAEAIVYADARDAKTIFGTPGATVFHDPVAQGTVVASRLPEPLNRIGLEAYKSFNGKTPDLLVIWVPQKIDVGNIKTTTFGTWTGLVNLDNSKDLTLMNEDKKKLDSNKILVSPVEVTTSRSPEEIKQKIEKFEKYGSAFFKGNTTIRYVPVLVLDLDRYSAFKDSQKKAIVKAMRKAGGIISLRRNLYPESKIVAKEAIDLFTPRIRDYNKLPSRSPSTTENLILQAPKLIIPQKPPSRELLANSKELNSKHDKEEKVTAKGFFERSKEWFNKIKQSFASNNKPQEETSTAPRKRLTSDLYKEMTSSLKETASYPQKAGIDIINNSNHLDLMLATQLMKKDIDYEKILKQSPNYRSKEPAEANSWLKKIIEDGISINKEYYLDSTGSQKIIRSYDNDKSRPPEKSDFEKLSDSVQKYNSSYSTDKQGLLVAVAKAAMKAGMDPEKVLKESPDYLFATSGLGKVLIEKTIEKAESDIQQERSRAEQQAERDNNRSDRGYER